MRRIILAVALIAFIPSAVAAARPMTAGEFLARAEPLLKKSKIALMLSSDARQLMRTVGDTAQNLRTRLDAERAAGRPATTCLPPKGKAAFSANELLGHIRALPPSQKNESFDQAFAGYMAKKYPCRR
jgi:hypothetical protein